MKLVGWTLAGATLVLALVYTVVSLVRWEWNRALFFAALVLVAEVGLATALVLGRLARLERRLGDLRTAGPEDPGTLATLRSSRGSHRRFAWLQVDPAEELTRSNVFITMMVGGGVVLSAGAWLVDKLASRTVDPAREASLARDLESIAYRPGLLVDEVTALARSDAHRDEPRLRVFLRRRP